MWKSSVMRLSSESYVNCDIHLVTRCSVAKSWSFSLKCCVLDKSYKYWYIMINTYMYIFRPAYPYYVLVCYIIEFIKIILK